MKNNFEANQITTVHLEFKITSEEFTTDLLDAKSTEFQQMKTLYETKVGSYLISRHLCVCMQKKCRPHKNGAV